MPASMPSVQVTLLLATGTTVAETGLMLHMDPWWAHLRVDEETGLYLFYHDQLTRLAGHNMQIRSMLGEREELDDQNESNRLRR